MRRFVHKPSILIVLLIGLHFVSPECEDGWEQSDVLGCLLKTNVVAQSMDQAEKLCKSHNAGLLKLDNDKEADAFLMMSSFQQSNSTTREKNVSKTVLPPSPSGTSNTPETTKPTTRTTTQTRELTSLSTSQPVDSSTSSTLITTQKNTLSPMEPNRRRRKIDQQNKTAQRSTTMMVQQKTTTFQKFFAYGLNSTSEYSTITNETTKETGNCKYITFHLNSTSSCDVSNKTHMFNCDDTMGIVETVCQKEPTVPGKDAAIAPLEYKIQLGISLTLVFMLELITFTSILMIFIRVWRARKYYQLFFKGLKALDERVKLQEYGNRDVIPVLELIGIDVKTWKSDRAKENEKADALAYVLKRDHLPAIVRPTNGKKKGNNKINKGNTATSMNSKMKSTMASAAKAPGKISPQGQQALQDSLASPPPPPPMQPQGQQQQDTRSQMKSVAYFEEIGGSNQNKGGSQMGRSGQKAGSARNNGSGQKDSKDVTFYRQSFTLMKAIQSHPRKESLILGNPVDSSKSFKSPAYS
ncbi:unnamed protein product, partial [Mesorhabditis belari]|uniref:C-type lectin domain-containing protein n=1 Tax=Mesorhabditis belari TaxID=2138241 RepID=A0AAF3EEU3_9BILA